MASKIITIPTRIAIKYCNLLVTPSELDVYLTQFFKNPKHLIQIISGIAQ
mgnify:CR=1 FL=1